MIRILIDDYDLEGVWKIVVKEKETGAIVGYTEITVGDNYKEEETVRDNYKEDKLQKPTIRLSDHFSYQKLRRFALPSVCMMLFTSIYSVVDGLFVSNIVGESAFASINLVMPYCMIFSSIGSIFGVGGSALCDWCERALCRRNC